MDREAQLRPIVKELCRFYECCNWQRHCFTPEVHGDFGKCDSVKHAENLIDAGYRLIPAELKVLDNDKIQQAIDRRQKYVNEIGERRDKGEITQEQCEALDRETPSIRLTIATAQRDFDLEQLKGKE